jgi:dynein light chain LC8-type
MAEKVDSQTLAGGSPAQGEGASTGTPGREQPKAVIKNVDMKLEEQQETIDIAAAVLEKHTIEKDIAAQIKKDLDNRFGPTWHVVVGKNFGSYVTHGELGGVGLRFLLGGCFGVERVGV